MRSRPAAVALGAFQILHGDERLPLRFANQPEIAETWLSPHGYLQWKEQVMGNRDKRGREKKKPKKKEIKPSSRPASPAPEYKPVAPPQPRPTDEGAS